MLCATVPCMLAHYLALGRLILFVSALCCHLGQPSHVRAPPFSKNVLSFLSAVFIQSSHPSMAMPHQLPDLLPGLPRMNAWPIRTSVSCSLTLSFAFLSLHECSLSVITNRTVLKQLRRMFRGWFRSRLAFFFYFNRLNTDWSHGIFFLSLCCTFQPMFARCPVCCESCL